MKIKLLQIIVTLAIFYTFFKNTNLTQILFSLKVVPLWYPISLLIYGIFIGILGSARLATLLFNSYKPNLILKLYITNIKSSVYSSLFQNSLATEVTRFLYTSKDFKNIPKARIMAIFAIDRIIGLFTLVNMGLISGFLSYLFNYQIPTQILYINLILFVGIIGVLVIAMSPLSNLIFIKKQPKLKKYLDYIDTVKSINPKILVLSIVISQISQFLWSIPVYTTSLFFLKNTSIWQTFTFLPIINLITSLPISYGGFGIRDISFFHFFSQLGNTKDSILAMTTFLGTFQIVSSFFFFLLLIFYKVFKR